MMLTRYALRTVPRYTSYPTAPHFTAAVDAATYAGWLAAAADAGPVSLYLHVPYCRAICHYCGCHTKAALRDGPLEAYADRLEEEIALVAAHLPARRAVSHIHWGGGTPSLLPAARFRALVRALRAAFEVRSDAEHAIELDPRHVDPALAATLQAAGITRASLGVQDLDPEVQRVMGRVQPFAVVAAAMAALRDVGIDALNLDLMYGLPRQTPATVRDTVRRVVDLAPARLALFGYAHVPWFKANQRLIDEAALPGAEARRDLEETARTELAAAGYVAIGLDHFARPDDPLAVAARSGALGRNFQGYTTDRAGTLIGFGASSIGHSPAGFVQNIADVAGWARAIAAGTLPVARGRALTADDRLRADIIMRLMCDHAVDLARIAFHHAVCPSSLRDDLARLDDLVADELVTVDGWQVRVTAAGRPYVRVVASRFDAYLDHAAARHSLAV